MNTLLTKCLSASRAIIIFSMFALVPSEAEAITEAELIDGYGHAYGASGRLTKGDFRLISKFELLQADWNATLAPLVRGLRDPNLDTVAWARDARQTIDAMTQIRVKMSIASAQIEDSGPRSITKDIDAINARMIPAWEDVRSAVMRGDDEAYREAGMRAQRLAQDKAAVAGPVIRRLREKFGDQAIDGALERELRELARKTGLN